MCRVSLPFQVLGGRGDEKIEGKKVAWENGCESFRKGERVWINLYADDLVLRIMVFLFYEKESL